MVRDLLEFVSIPSISSDPARRADVARCAHWLAERLRRAGLPDVRVVRTSGHPSIVARTNMDPRRRTVLLYGHYDVQPAGKGWTTPAFRPVVRNGAVYGRGASDDKGQILAHVMALESLLGRGALSVNLVCVFEGEEEIGSPNLPGVLRALPPLRPWVAVMSDTQMLEPDRPAITIGLRGSMSVDVVVRRPGSELHSGRFGGGVPDPPAILSRLIASLHGAKGRIAIEGFHDRVRRRTAARPLTARERVTVRPAITVTGMGGGHERREPRSSIATEAWARLNVRLALDQRPGEAAQQIKRHLAVRAPRGAAVEIRTGSLVPPAEVDRHHPAMQAASDAYLVGFGRRPEFVHSGGTIPAVGMIHRELGIQTVMMGFASPDDRAHGPNEHFRLDTLRRATRSIRFLLGRRTSRPGH